MTIQDLHFAVREADRLTVSVDVIGVSHELESELVGTIRLDVREGYLEIEVEKEAGWTGPVETTIA
jgi:hypothetical protein